MNRASCEKRILYFKKPAGTSRGFLREKTSWFIHITDGAKTGVGECSLIPGLSPDAVPEIEEIIKASVSAYNHEGRAGISPQYPALRFAWEAALLDFEHGGRGILFPSDFTEGKKGIEINGLVWMSEPEEMMRQVGEKVSSGFRCIKLKIGALPFETELQILSEIRKKYGPALELRLDANGAFSAEDAGEKLQRLSEFDIHSIEQPIKPGQWSEMSKLCRSSPIPIALDEELIGLTSDQHQEMLDVIRPRYIILKPSMLGGFRAADEWIKLAEERDIGWWATSALESNIGLSAIAQWVGAKDASMPQGLGTGGLFVNNTKSRTEIQDGRLFFDFHTPATG